MDLFKTTVLIIIAISFIFIVYSLVSNLWFFKKEDKISGSKDTVIFQILKLAYNCYQKNLNIKRSVICEKIQVFPNENISADEIFSRLDERKINRDNFFVEDLYVGSKVIIKYDNGNIFIEGEKYESISS